MLIKFKILSCYSGLKFGYIVDVWIICVTVLQYRLVVCHRIWSKWPCNVWTVAVVAYALKQVQNERQITETCIYFIWKSDIYRNISIWKKHCCVSLDEVIYIFNIISFANVFKAESQWNFFPFIFFVIAFLFFLPPNDYGLCFHSPGTSVNLVHHFVTSLWFASFTAAFCCHVYNNPSVLEWPLHFEIPSIPPSIPTKPLQLSSIHFFVWTPFFSFPEEAIQVLSFTWEWGIFLPIHYHQLPIICLPLVTSFLTHPFSVLLVFFYHNRRSHQSVNLSDVSSILRPEGGRKKEIAFYTS